jgi:putative spermidine/putrescine transport system permease protein
MKRISLLLAPPVTCSIAFFALPLLFMAYRSVTTISGALTLDHYARFAGDPYYIGGLFITLGTALLVTAITLAIAYPMALLYWRASARLKSFLIILLLSPFYANIVVKVFGWMLILPSAWLNGYGGLLIVSVHRDLPFMVLLVAAAMSRIDRDWIDSAETCGASRMRVLRTIIWPLSIPGVVSGCTLVFSLTMAAYVVPALVGGPWRGRFLPVLLYQQMTIAQDWSFGAVIGVVLLTASLATIAAGRALVKRCAVEF